MKSLGISIVPKSIVLTRDGVCPPCKTTLVLFDAPADWVLDCVKSPKSVALDVEAISIC